MPLSKEEIKKRAAIFIKEWEINEDARAQFPDSSLADLYDPNTMPPVLVKVHQQLDKAVDLCYGVKAFGLEAKRMEFLFELYEGYVRDGRVKRK